MMSEKPVNGNNNSRKVALITGVAGQDGSYLAELLLSKGYEVHGIIRRSSSFNTGRIEHLYRNPELRAENSLKLHYGDMTDSSNMMKLIAAVQPSEIYNLAAQSHVKVSFELPEYTAEVDGMGTLRLLDALLASRLPGVRFYQASTSELYGKVLEVPQRETTPFYPRSPYAVAKQFAFWTVVNYREAYGVFAVNGILFNHESPRRGENFVTRKVTRAVAKISLGQQQLLELGNLNARRDWGHARDYVEAMWLMLQQAAPRDLVIATHQTHSVREFVELAFREVGVAISWSGEGLDEQGRDAASGALRVRVNAKFYRPTEVDELLGDSSLAQQLLGWKPRVSFAQLVSEMVAADVELMRRNPLA